MIGSGRHVVRVLMLATLTAASSLLVVAGASGASATLNSWTSSGQLGIGRANATATLLGDGDVLLAGGETASAAPIADVELYDPSSGSWQETGGLPVPVYDSTATRLA